MSIVDLSKVRQDQERLKKLAKAEKDRKLRARDTLIHAAASIISIFTKNITDSLADKTFSEERFNFHCSACNFILQELSKAYGWKVDAGEVPIIYAGTVTKPEDGLPTFTFAVGGIYEKEVLTVIAAHNPGVKIPEFPEGA